ncbi:MAG: hypothetical protein ACRCTZ_13845, partial [Sarcina sp.]
SSNIILDGNVQPNMELITQDIPILIDKSYGIKVDLSGSGQGTITRLGDAVGKTLDDFYNIFPWASIKRQVIDGQYMVRIPKFYYKRVATTTEDIPQSPDGNEIGKQLIVWEDWISPTPQDGYFVHPAFIRNGKIQDYFWIGAFEGSIQKADGTYLMNDEQTADFNTDKLSSIVGAKPCSGLTQQLTIENSRKLANNRSSGSNFSWQQQDFTMVSAIQMLIVISTGSYNCQSSIGQGVVSITDIPTDNCAIPTGATLSMGIRCGSADNMNDGKHSVNFFGIENFWGNIWKFVDGINIEGKTLNQGWISNDDYTVNTSTNKTNLGFTIGKKNGYISKIGYNSDVDFCFIPSGEDGGKIISADYFYQNASYNGFLIARLGGYWNDGSYAGCFYWSAHIAASFRNRSIGARLACIIK